MAVDERTRHQLHRRLEAVLGAEEAATLMEHLPPATWRDLATTQDLRAELALLRTDLRAEIAEARSELQAEIAEARSELQAEIAELRTEVRTGLADVRTELRTGLADVRTELRTGLADVRIELHRGLVRQTWITGGLIASFNAALAAILTTAS